MKPELRILLWGVCSLSCVVGCSEPRAVGVPKVDGQSISAAAFEMHDRNGDRLIQDDELTPGMRAALKLIDANNDQAIAPEELAARVDAWKNSGAGLIPVRCALTYRNKPLVGATIELAPEHYLSDTILPATGKTNRFGWANLSIPVELRPGNEQRAGIQFGIYRVSVSLKEDGKEALPVKFNEETELGIEVSMDAPGVQAGLVQIELN